MKKIIILRGNSGSGKTTVARALQKKFGCNTIMISQDEIRRNILWVKDGVDTKALPLMIELMKYGYEHCDVVILEGIMYDEWYSPLFKTANELYGMDIYAYYFDIPLKRRSGGIIQEIKNRNLVKKICVDGGEKRIFHQFLMKKLLHLILMQTVLLK